MEVINLLQCLVCEVLNEMVVLEDEFSDFTVQKWSALVRSCDSPCILQGEISRNKQLELFNSSSNSKHAIRGSEKLLEFLDRPTLVALLVNHSLLLTTVLVDLNQH